MREIKHVGVPRPRPHEGEVYVEGLKVWLTEFTQSENKIEYLRFEECSWMPESIQKLPHIAYEVEDLNEELKGKKVIVEPMEGGENLMIAFIEEEGLPIEIMQFTNN